MKGLSLGASPPAPAGQSRLAAFPPPWLPHSASHTHTPVRRPPAGPPAQAAAGFHGLDLWAASAEGGIDLKSHRKVKLGSKESFCRRFLKKCQRGRPFTFSECVQFMQGRSRVRVQPRCCPRGPRGQGVCCQPLRSCLLPEPEQGWGRLGAEKDRG